MTAYFSTVSAPISWKTPQVCASSRGFVVSLGVWSFRHESDSFASGSSVGRRITWSILGRCASCFGWSHRVIFMQWTQARTYCVLLRSFGPSRWSIFISAVAFLKLTKISLISAWGQKLPLLKIAQLRVRNFADFHGTHKSQWTSS